MIDPNMTLHGKYKLKDLCITNTGLDNTPTEDLHVNNLRWLAVVLSELEPSLGPFTVLSAYRTREVNNKVTGNNDPNRKTSFHEVGMAVDFYPLNQSINTYFGRLITTEWKEKLGEIILKPKQNSIHIGLPTSSYKGAIKILDPQTNSYRYMTPEEIEEHSEPYRMSTSPESESALDFMMSYPDPSGGIYTNMYSGSFGIYPAIGLGEELTAMIEDEGVEGDVEEASSSRKFLLAGVVTGIMSLLAYALWPKRKE